MLFPQLLLAPPRPEAQQQIEVRHIGAETAKKNGWFGSLGSSKHPRRDPGGLDDELSQGQPGGPSSSAVLSAPQVKCLLRMAGQAPSWCSWDLGLGPPGDEIALVHVARPPATASAPALFRTEPGGWPGARSLGRQRLGPGSKRPCGRPSTGIPWPGLSRSPAPSLPAPTGGSQKVVIPYLSVSDSKTSTHPSSTLSSPWVAHTPQAVAWQLSSVVALQQRNTTLSAVVAPSDWRPGGRGFNPRRGRQHSFMEIDHEIFSTVILSLPLIQEGQLSVSGERMCTILVNRLED